MSTEPSWPSLYNWAIEIFPIEGKDPVQPEGFYLYDRTHIFRFTLYWTLVFYTPAYILCASYAFLNLTFPPTRIPRRSPRTRSRSSFGFPFPSSYFAPAPPVTSNEIPLLEAVPNNVPRNTQAQAALAYRYRALFKPNERRSRLAVALLVFLAFTVFSVAGAVIGSVIIGYLLAALFKAGGYNMSTWMPFLAGLLQALVGLLGLWPSVIDFI
ncbi:uncharacterized protein B0H18DRAFT_645932 [Fomitopsis serialis]|uniref:uncharacterized protein n=1 Tax=Fomitopsis serialis TaxID=139415 RepID=UPI002008B798|nr:uncharacterized protein B0H18DRAFT_645932 [Neoantrodia serialis]KAH9933449.1 hypothetical protein B0H18DRAFT_645932 [Neoantrodia serialis]